MSLERVHKIIARAGLMSRRKAEQLIQEGLVSINGKVAKVGDQAEAGKDSIKVEGKLLQLKQPLTYVAFNKPRGVITTFADDPQGLKNLKGYFPHIRARIFPVGRMDFNSEGLLLLTTDGDFAEKLQKSKSVPKIYHVKVKGHPPKEALARLAKPRRQGAKVLAPYAIRELERFQQKTLIEVVVLEGGLDIKSFFEQKLFLVERIVRTAIGQIELGNLKVGEHRFLKKSQVDAILRQPELGLRGIDAGVTSLPPVFSREEQEEKKPASRLKPKVLARPLRTPARSRRF